MKTYDVLLTEQAEKDLDGIFEYIAFTLGCCWRQEIPTMPLNHQSKKKIIQQSAKRLKNLKYNEFRRYSYGNNSEIT